METDQAKLCIHSATNIKLYTNVWIVVEVPDQATELNCDVVSFTVILYSWLSSNESVTLSLWQWQTSMRQIGDYQYLEAVG